MIENAVCVVVRSSIHSKEVFFVEHYLKHQTFVLFLFSDDSYGVKMASLDFSANLKASDANFELLFRIKCDNEGKQLFSLALARLPYELSFFLSIHHDTMATTTKTKLNSQLCHICCCGSTDFK